MRLCFRSIIFFVWGRGGGGGGAGSKKLGVCPLTSRCSATELFQELHVAHGPVGVLEGR